MVSRGRRSGASEFRHPSHLVLESLGSRVTRKGYYLPKLVSHVLLRRTMFSARIKVVGRVNIIVVVFASGG